MRRITLWLLGTVSSLVLLFSYHTSTVGAAGAGAVASAPRAAASAPAAAPSAAAAPPDPTATAPAPTATAPASAATSAAPAPRKTAAAAAARSVTGPPVDTRWGPVQIRITVAGSKITDVQAVVYPDGNMRDQEINAQALPMLREEALTAQSARIDAVSGATVTSDGYISSLQSAIDSAHLKG